MQSVCPLDWLCLFKQLLPASLSQGTFMSLLSVPTATSVLFRPKLSLICVYFLTPSCPMRPSTPLESGCQADCLPRPSEDPAHSRCARNIGGCQAQINKCMHEYMKTASMYRGGAPGPERAKGSLRTYRKGVTPGLPLIPGTTPDTLVNYRPQAGRRPTKPRGPLCACDFLPVRSTHSALQPHPGWAGLAQVTRGDCH